MSDAVGRTGCFAGTGCAGGGDGDCRDGEVAYQTCYVVYEMFSMIRVVEE